MLQGGIITRYSTGKCPEEAGVITLVGIWLVVYHVMLAHGPYWVPAFRSVYGLPNKEVKLFYNPIGCIHVTMELSLELILLHVPIPFLGLSLFHTTALGYKA